jgi:hypothetical protein
MGARRAPGVSCQVQTPKLHSGSQKPKTSGQGFQQPVPGLLVSSSRRDEKLPEFRQNPQDVRRIRLSGSPGARSQS